MSKIANWLTNLKTGFMTMGQYQEAVVGGVFPARQWFDDDKKFALQYPLHPLNEDNRFTRISAADALRDYAQSLRETLPAEVLSSLYVHMFDCSPSVRQSLVMALFYAGDASAVDPLDRLLAEETNLNLREYIKAAKDRAYLRHDKATYVPSAPNQIVIVSDCIDTVVTFQKYAAENGCQLVQAQPDTPDVIAFPAVLYIIDRRILGYEAWRNFLHYLYEVYGDPSAESDRQMLLNQVTIEGEVIELPPLIILDGFTKSPDFQLPSAPSGKLMVMKGWSDDSLLFVVQRMLNGGFAEEDYYVDEEDEEDEDEEG